MAAKAVVAVHMIPSPPSHFLHLSGFTTGTRRQDMDGMHDLGGKQGFGRIRYSPKAQTYHAPWEKRVNAMTGLAVKHGIINMDEYRHAIERMEPRHYLSASYYERSLTGLATLCVEKGVVTQEELERRAQGNFPL